jgi:hypothetical protein
MSEPAGHLATDAASGAGNYHYLSFKAARSQVEPGGRKLSIIGHSYLLDTAKSLQITFCQE